ncbi:MAG: putative motility protein [Candidatus Latescibacterota bacterium]|jgi:hypothetical protein|tara:strand:- start:664 stop:867 length:204 start_codon:yes stop_codon:yes gene_type:complete
MGEISGSTDSLISLGMAMKDVQLKSAFSISMFKKGLDAQSQAAVSLGESIPAAPNTAQTGQQIDMMA